MKGRIWIGLGVLFLAAALALTGYNMWEADRADRASQAAAAKLKTAMAEAGESDEVPEDLLPADREMPTIEIDGYRYIGYLEIPSLSLTLPVMDEWDYDRLKIAPCRYSGTVYRNDMVIAGHNYRRHFSRLKWEDIGIEILFTDVENNVYRYRLTDVEILKSEQVGDLIAESEDWDLTLFTCTTGGRTRHIMRCSRVEDEETGA